jgi:hypothetical protein
MGRLVDSETTTGTVNDDGEDSVTLTTRAADRVTVLVDDNTDPGNDHAGYELQIEVNTPTGWMEYTTLGSDSSPETARSWDLEGIPNQMRITLVNRSGGQADHALHATSVEEA